MASRQRVPDGDERAGAARRGAGMVVAAAWLAVVPVPVVTPSTATDVVLAIGSWGLIGGWVAARAGRRVSAG